MKTKSLARLLVVLILSISVLLMFTACKDDEIYAGSDDFASYPDSWNGFNEDTGDLYIPQPNGTAPSVSQESGTSSDDADISSEDFTVNFTDEDEETASDTESKKEEATSSDTDNDGITDDKDPDDDNDGTTDDKDPDDDNDGIPDDEEKPDYGNQGPLVFF